MGRSPARTTTLALAATFLAFAALPATSTLAATTGGASFTPKAKQISRLIPHSSSGGASYQPSLGAAPKPAEVRPTKPRDTQPPARSKNPGLHDFPVAGPYSLGGKDARFGAKRPGHIHQGQDILAAAGTPVVAPHGGLISWRANQPKGAGLYVVLNSVEEQINYVFMHLLRGSVPVRVGDRVRTGQQIGSVGQTGAASTPHLHFEVWEGTWYGGGHPVDPLPLLKAWVAGS